MKGKTMLSRNKMRTIGPRFESEGPVRLIPGDRRKPIVLVRRRCRIPSVKAKANIARSKANIKNQLTIPTDGMFPGTQTRSVGESKIGTRSNLVAFGNKSFSSKSLTANRFHIQSSEYHAGYEDGSVAKKQTD